MHAVAQEAVVQKAGGRMLRGVGSPVKGYEATLCQRLRAAL